jgi:crotonobetainyl-CoA:carnitine CoA-transferase CaiB-like acyl-CoA transferase
MTNSPLKGLTIIDLSYRLPGPLCGKIFSDLGAKVIKIEDHQFQDPFLSSLFAQIDSSFISWYENLNAKKQILRFDFDAPFDQKKIRDLVLSADAVIMGLPSKTREKLQLTDTDLTLSRPMAVIELFASINEKKPMHDLNALAESGLLSLFVAGLKNKEKIIDPPFLPIAGINFGHKAAIDLMASYILATKTNRTQFVKTYLDQVTKELLGIFWPLSDREQGRTRFLHNGAYPCYTIYQTGDGHYIALAAVEEKYWNKFCEIFQIKNFSPPKRFHNSDREIFKLISNEIFKYSLVEIEEMTKNEELCLSLIS